MGAEFTVHMVRGQLAETAECHRDLLSGIRVKFDKNATYIIDIRTEKSIRKRNAFTFFYRKFDFLLIASISEVLYKQGALPCRVLVPRLHYSRFVLKILNFKHTPVCDTV